MSTSTIAPTQDVEKLRVVYSGSIQFPVCVGTVVVPLLNSQTRNDATKDSAGKESYDSKSEKMHTRSRYRQKNPISAARFTHRRYCYIRDGSDLREDAFYRWLDVELANHTPRDKQVAQEEVFLTNVRRSSPSRDSSAEHTDPDHPQRKLHRLDHDRGPSTEHTTKDNLSNGPDDATGRHPSAPKSASFFYAMVHHVVFILPDSFPQPRRVIYEPPFIIQDDSWAEHLIEIHVFFQPQLCIPPMSLLQRAFLYRREPNLVPSLQAQPLVQTKPPVAVSAVNRTAANIPGSDCEYEIYVESILDPHFTTMTEKAVEEIRSSPSGDPSTRVDGASCAIKDALHYFLDATIVVERQDMIKIWHPTLPVLHFWRAILSKNDDAIIQDLRDYFVTYVYDTPVIEGGLAVNALNALNVSIRCKREVEINLKQCSNASKAESMQKQERYLYLPKRLLSLMLAQTPRTPLPSKGQEQTQRKRVNADAWVLPYELVILVNESRRSFKAVRVLDHTLQNLLEEQKKLLITLDQVITEVVSTSENIEEELNALHEACMSLSPHMDFNPPRSYLEDEEMTEANSSMKISS